MYVAEDVRLKRRVALKLLHPALAADAAFLRRFQAEAQTVAALRHQGIVRVYDWGEDGGNAYLTMELLEGGSLRSLLDSGHRLSVSQVAAVGLDVASALAYAHARGLVHRDVKPANLLFDEEGHGQRGRLRYRPGAGRGKLDRAPRGRCSVRPGTPPPKQLKGAPLDGRADVYALALVAVEAVTGDVPFARDTTLGALMARAEPAPFRSRATLARSRPVIEKAGATAPGTASAQRRSLRASPTWRCSCERRRPCPCRVLGLFRTGISAASDGRSEGASPARRARGHHPGGGPAAVVATRARF